jgi:hypothetical protein
LVSNLNMSNPIDYLGFTNSNQQLTWTADYTIPVTAYLWGGGGGGGGNDSNPGGAGSGGGFSQVSFFLSPGETLTVAVGAPGRAGASRRGSAPGGSQGASYFNSTNGYWGGPGGSAGPAGSSGGGGGGGGATVLLKNNTVIGIAGGGAGGGGGGNSGAAAGQNAPGSSGQLSNSGGGSGTNKTGDGGGGGGGGGGLQGGAGGTVPGGDQGGFAGSFGTSLGDIVFNPTGRNAANSSSSFYVGSPGVGGVTAASGSAGLAVIEFGITGVHVHDGTEFKPVSQIYIKQNNLWQSVKRTWIKQNNIWTPVVDSFSPIFNQITGNYGTPGKVCVGVCDEASSPSQSTMNSNWNTFLARFPTGQLYCLQPGDRGGMKVPPNFTSSGQGFGPILVNRDNGNSSNVSDWFAICNLGSVPSGTTVQYSIDNSGSMTTETVSASLALFLQQCSQAGLPTQRISMSDENWIAPFI